MNQKQMIEEVKKQRTKYPAPAQEEQLDQVMKEAKEKIDAIANKVEATYYKNNNSITTIEEERELILLAGNEFLVAISIVTPSDNPIASVITNRSNNSITDNKPVASSVT